MKCRQELANTLLALGKLGVAWPALSEPARSRLLSALEEHGADMTPAGTAMSLLGLGRMQLQWRELPAAARAALCASFQRVLPAARADEDVAALLHALSHVHARWEDMRYTSSSVILRIACMINLYCAG
jgi:hypothetical protein